ncbi:hypothetical protein LS482_11050 [Sinomicrobium kalidii]|uniref:hypothetical protein n=1 Tax=Sinomicrobium kalidii TaxID=2900738 RepID=UPI001E659255|nr:hypothetical protein [Sinomicrobium kalidii]UGU14250.1 hypothetical protein LS482_11050 [Sinomicrobium kalidii]
MKYPILLPDYLSDFSEFIAFWSKQYYYPTNISYYSENIHKKEYTEEDITDLYTWKNGMKLSVKKEKSLQEKILAKLEILNVYKKEKELPLNAFLSEFKGVSFVWKIFLLHILKPDQYPIYDQHIHRAFKYLHPENGNLQKVSKNEFYFDHYLLFIKQQGVKDLKKLDEAFFAFGQFLNTKKYRTLLNTRTNVNF